MGSGLGCLGLLAVLAGLASLFLLLVWGPIGRRLHLERLGLIKAGAEHPDLPTLSDLKFDPASLRLAPGGAWVVGVASVEGRRSVVGLQVPVVPRAEAVEPALTWVRSGWSAGDPVRVLVLNGKTLVQRRDGSAAVLKEADGKLAGEVMLPSSSTRACVAPGGHSVFFDQGPISPSLDAQSLLVQSTPRPGWCALGSDAAECVGKQECLGALEVPPLRGFQVAFALRDGRMAVAAGTRGPSLVPSLMGVDLSYGRAKWTLELGSADKPAQPGPAMLLALDDNIAVARVIDSTKHRSWLAAVDVSAGQLKWSQWLGLPESEQVVAQIRGGRLLVATPGGFEVRALESGQLIATTASASAQ